jgi:hypothetical protein
MSYVQYATYPEREEVNEQRLGGHCEFRSESGYKRVLSILLG